MDFGTHQRFASLGAFLVLTGCPGSLQDPGRFDVAVGVEAGVEAPSILDAGCPDIPSTLSTACAGAGCHSTADRSQGLDLQSPNVASRLVCASAVGGGLLVDPSAPAQSVLYTKLSSSPPFGARMPSGAAPFDDATRACILTWISDVDADGGPCGAASYGDGSAQGKSTSDAGSDGARD
jgi:hypothetical protein